MRGTRPVLAVLPFTVLGGQADDDVIAQGLASDLAGEFARFSEIYIVAFHSSQAVASMNDSEAARTLGVTHLLRGVYQRISERVRITATLVDGASTAQIWSERFETSAGNLFEIQDELIARIAATLTTRIEEAILRQSRGKPPESLVAYDLTLRGYALVRQGTASSDAHAKTLFEAALKQDPHYARAYTGLSIATFNAWSYQFWDCFEDKWQQAYHYAHTALDLDNSGALQHLVLGRLLLFRREFEQASWYFDRAHMLCPNNADMLIHLALYATFLGRPEQGLEHARKAIRLNPYHPNEYYICLSFPQLLMRDFEGGLATISKVNDLSAHWKALCVPAYTALALVNIGTIDEAQHNFAKFNEAYRSIIALGKDTKPGEASAWLLQMHPYRRQEDIDFILEGFGRLGDASVPRPSAPLVSTLQNDTPCLRREGGGWCIHYAGRKVHLSDMKGIHDIRRLIERPFEDVHCLDLSGRGDAYGGEDALDDKARQSLKARIRDLQEELADAEDMNDFARADRTREELEHLVEALSKALGLGGRNRRLGNLCERARTTVTWRIRSAIRKIEAENEPLGRHFKNSIRTGVFCSYRPEQPITWQL